MEYYFKLQIKRIQRKLISLGISPTLFIILAIALFITISKLLFLKTEYAYWVYGLFAISFVSNLGEIQRNNQLKIIFNKTTRLKIRVMENMILSSPFIIYLIYEQKYLMAIGVILVSFLLPLFNLYKQFNAVIPTPFNRLPFENIVGFRKTIVILIAIYFIIFKGIQVDNFNLSIVALGILYFVFMSYHSKPEKEYFVWIFNSNSKAFLNKKVLESITATSVTSLPALLAICTFFPDKIYVSLLVFGLGVIFLISMIYAKYSAYPGEINLPQAILFGISIWFPPMLLIVIPMFYKRSLKNIKKILE